MAMTPERWQRIKAVFAAALERSGEERSAFVAQTCAGDHALEVELKDLLAAHELPGGLLQSPTVPRSEETGATETGGATVPEVGRVGPYRIVGELGHGGMGTVFLAERDDAEYRKEVALKIIRRGMDSAAVVARFRNERQLLAALSHPNIATLLDGGTTADGSPYFVMEYVAGEPIDRYCDARALSVPQRLALFLAVCDAVQQAHAKLIVHRDIKAANILVTAGGVPKLLDFGVAKLLDEESAAERTETQVRFFTPAFASPEQFRGGLISTATDVYQLGVLLYILVTGLKPHETEGRSTEEVQRAVCEEEPARPSRAAMARKGPDAALALSGARGTTPEKLRRLLSGDVDTIVMKALEKEPARRYGSVEALANDVRRHLAGLPIMARPGNLGYRASRFVGRHRLSLGAAALVVIALSGSLVEIARQKARAERRFNDVRKLANSFLFEFHDAIKSLPGSTAARALVVKKGLEYLDGLAQEAGSDRALQSELAQAYERMGDVQGADRTGNLGTTEAARDSYRKAIALRETLVASNPRDARLRSALSAAYGKSAYLRFLTGDPTGAAAVAAKAVALDERLAAEAPGDRKARERLADSTSLRGYLLGASGNAEGLAIARKGLSMLEAIAADRPEDAEVRTKLATTHGRIAEILEGLLGDARGALVTYEKAAGIEEALSAADPLDPSLRFRLAARYADLGDVEVKLGNRAAALSRYRQALAAIETLSLADPANGHYRSSLGAASERVGRIEVEVGEVPAGLAKLRQAVAIAETELAAEPSSGRNRALLASAAEGMGRALERLARTSGSNAQRWREARSWYQRSKDLWLDLRKQGATTGEEAAMPEKLEAEIAACDSALGNLRRRP